MRLLMTRMEPDASQMARVLKNLGHEVYCNPLMSIRFLPVDVSLFHSCQALVLTSKNALRALATMGGLENCLPLPVFCVGSSTSQMARDTGFKTVIEGPGTAEGLVQTIRDHPITKNGPLLYLTGADLAFPLHETLQSYNISIERRIVYETCGVTDLSPETKSALAKGQIDGVILMSPKTARVWAKLVGKSGLFTEVSHLPVFCLSKRIAQQLTSSDGSCSSIRTYCARQPTLESLLTLVDELNAECKK